MYIAIEGVDGCGKDTQLKLLLGYLIDYDKHLVLLKSREPSLMTSAGKRLNEIAQQHIHLSALESAQLFAQDRRELQAFRRPLLEHGVWIVASRCDLTTYAYQGYAAVDAVDFSEIYQMHSDILVPDITIVLTISLEVMFARLGVRTEAKEVYEQEDFLRRGHEGYVRGIAFLRSQGRTILEMDGEGSPEEVHRRIVDALKQRGVLEFDF